MIVALSHVQYLHSFEYSHDCNLSAHFHVFRTKGLSVNYVTWNLQYFDPANSLRSALCLSTRSVSRLSPGHGRCRSTPKACYVIYGRFLKKQTCIFSIILRKHVCFRNNCRYLSHARFLNMSVSYCSPLFRAHFLNMSCFLLFFPSPC